jgi:thiamine biosynthesis protein ThiS
MDAKTVIESLQYLSDEHRAKYMQGYFRANPGQYAEGDIFWGIKVPEIKQVAKAYLDIPFTEAGKLIKNPVHEVRLCALLIFVEQFKRTSPMEKKIIVDLYLSNIKYVNHWDLVDLSCYNILGKYLLDKPRNILYRLAKSDNMWEQRIAIVSTKMFIRNHDFEDALALLKILLISPHELVQKAMGWMLREISKRDELCMIGFVQKHYASMSRVTLRFAIEKLPEKDRKNLLKKKSKIMTITINNKPYKIDEECNLIGILNKVQITNQFGIALAVNNVVIPKTEWEKYTVKDKDTILVINAIFGG